MQIFLEEITLKVNFHFANFLKVNFFHFVTFYAFWSGVIHQSVDCASGGELSLAADLAEMVKPGFCKFQTNS